jgi:uncharacterized membrane protein
MFVADWLTNLPHTAATFLLAMIPVSEYRVAMPVALEVYNLNFCTAFLLTIVGSSLPALILLLIIKPIFKFAARYSRPIHKFLNWLFEHIQSRHERKFEIYKDLILILLVAIPIPLTGVYTGALASYVFGIPFRRAFPLILGSVILGTLIIAGITIGFKNIF